MHCGVYQSEVVSDNSWCSGNYITVPIVALRPPTVSIMSPAHVAQTHRMFHILHLSKVLW